MGRGQYTVTRQRRKQLRTQWDRALDVIRIKTRARNRLRDRNFDLIEPHVQRAKKNGCRTLVEIADYLNAKGLRTWRNEPWTKSRLDWRRQRQERRTLDQRVRFRQRFANDTTEHKRI